MSDEMKVNVSGHDMLVMVVRYILCVIFPPLAVFDKGCGSMLLVFIFTCIGWLPGTVLAFLICLKDKHYFLKKSGEPEIIDCTEVHDK